MYASACFFWRTDLLPVLIPSHFPFGNKNLLYLNIFQILLKMTPSPQYIMPTFLYLGQTRHIDIFAKRWCSNIEGDFLRVKNGFVVRKNQDRCFRSLNFSKNKKVDFFMQILSFAIEKK